mgnify:CR=1 FL=1
MLALQHEEVCLKAFFTNRPAGDVPLTPGFVAQKGLRSRHGFGSPPPDDRSRAPKGADQAVSHNASLSRRGSGGGTRSGSATGPGPNTLRIEPLRYGRAPGVSGFHIFAFLRGRMTAWASRAAMASSKPDDIVSWQGSIQRQPLDGLVTV